MQRKQFSKMEESKLASETNGNMFTSVNEDADLSMTPLGVSDDENNLDIKSTSLSTKTSRRDPKAIKNDLEEDIKEIFGEKKTKTMANKNNRKSSISSGGSAPHKSPASISIGRSPIRNEKAITSPTKFVQSKNVIPEASTSSEVIAKRSRSQMENEWLPSNENECEFLLGFDDEGDAVFGPIDEGCAPLAKKIKDDIENFENAVPDEIIETSKTKYEDKNPMVLIENPPEMKDKINISSTKSPRGNLKSPQHVASTDSQKILSPSLVTKKENSLDDESTLVAEAISQSSSSSSIGSKLKPSEDPIYRKPFEMGWKREIVLRAMPGSKDKGEVYYITPNGKKLRTRNEIQNHLTTGLTLDNFTFSKDPIGGNSDEEIIRNAKITGRTSDIVLGKRVPKPKAPKGASPPPQSVAATSSTLLSQSWSTSTSSSGNKNLSSKSSDRHNSLSSSRQNSRTSEEEHRSNNKSFSNKTNKKGEPCTIQCTLAMGMIPQLQCIKCLCLYHHECVGLDRNDDDFRLNKAKLGNNNSDNTNNENILGKSLKDYECKSCKNQMKSAHKPESNDSIISASPKIPPPSSSSASSSHIIDKPSRRSSARDSKTSGHNKHNKGDGGNNILQRSLSHSSNNDLYIEKSSKLPQSIAVLNGRKYLVIRNLEPDDATESDGGAAASNVENHYSSSSKRRSTSGHNTASNSSSKILKIDSFANNFFGNVSLGYDILLQIFQYLKVQELLRAACVCRVWNIVANHRSLWKTVRMKNSQVNDWIGLAASLRRNETQHLDLRKMLCLNSEDQMWSNFAENIKTVVTLQTIDLGRCTSDVVQNLFLTAPQLRNLNAISIRGGTINLQNLNNMKNLEELRLKTNDGFSLDGDLTPLETLINLRHLSLTSLVNELGSKNIEVLGNLINLESLEIGECSTFGETFATEILPKLTKLERLRLEKSTESSITFEILKTISQMENLQQLELVNFDIREGFETYLISCKHLKRLLLIPTYISQSATTNQIILSSMRKFTTLDSLTWVVTMELLRVTALYVDQCEAGTKDKKNFEESIPVLKPVPGINEEQSLKSTSDIQQVEILPLSKIKEILADGMPNTKFRIVKVAYHATWRQNFVE